MKAIKIDANGLFVEDVIVNEDFEQTSDIITVPCSDGFYKPKWDGAKWIEGLTQDEIDLIKNRPQPPTEMETLKIRLKTAERIVAESSETIQGLLELLIDMEAI